MDFVKSLGYVYSVCNKFTRDDVASGPFPTFPPSSANEVHTYNMLYHTTTVMSSKYIEQDRTIKEINDQTAGEWKKAVLVTCHMWRQRLIHLDLNPGIHEALQRAPRPK
jgi:hypothetical protein